MENRTPIPAYRKLNLTIAEASEYSNIGEKRIRELCSEPDCNFTLRVGTKTLIKRKKFEEYISNRTVL